jgi:hypothetical protein
MAGYGGPLFAPGARKSYKKRPDFATSVAHDVANAAVGTNVSELRTA